MVGIIPAGERDSVEECHRYLVEKYDPQSKDLRAKHSAVSLDSLTDRPRKNAVFVLNRFVNLVNQVSQVKRDVWQS